MSRAYGLPWRPFAPGFFIMKKRCPTATIIGVLLLALSFSRATGLAVSMDALRAEAEAGSADAMLELALGYDDGSLGEKDRALAAEWYRRAAAAGVAVAHLRLGILHEVGDGVPQDYAAAHAAYEAAIAAGVDEANLRLGLMYFEGWGVDRDPERAVELIERAAEADYEPAQLMLADIYMLGIRVEKDPTRALAWAERAAKKDSAGGENRVANAARKGLGVERDLDLARQWYQLSAEQEYTRAMLGMAATFRDSERTRENFRMMMRWLKLAAENESHRAQFIIAGITLASTKQPRHHPQAEWLARDYLHRSAKGFPKAVEVLAAEGEERSLLEAYRYVLKTSYEQRYVARAGSAAVDPRQRQVRPRITEAKKPEFPAALRLTETVGEARVKFVVMADGSVADVETVSASHPAFGEAAVDAVRQWRFEPGRVDGRAVNTRLQVPVYFKLEE